MADIPSANITNALHMNHGSLKAWKAKIKGDGAGTTISLPFGRVEFYVIQNITETAALRATESGNIITYAAAPTNNLYHWLWVVGY